MSKLNGTLGLGLGLGLSAAAGVVLGACSLAVDFTECRDDGDCQTQGGPWQCVAGRCVEPADSGSTGTTEPGTSAPTTGTGTDPGSSGEPSTTAVTVTTGETSGTDTDTTTGPQACTLNTECEAELGVGHLCIEGSCVSALTEECVKLVWPGKNASHDKVVLIGSTIPASPPFDSLTVPLQNAIQLAIEDYNATTDLPGGNRVAWLACDDRGSVERAVKIAEHLTGTLKVQALVGPLFSEQVLAVAEQVTIPAGVFTITPSATAKEITTLKDNNLVWRPIASDVYQANAIADRVLALDPKAAKVAMLGKNDVYGTGLISDVTKVLSPLLKAGFKSWPYSDPATLPQEELAAEYALIVGQAWGTMGMHPDTMLFAGTSEVASLVLLTMKAWGGENPLPAPPRMIVSHGAVPVMEATVAMAPQNIKGLLMTYLEGVAPVIFDPQNFAAFNLRYRLRFDGIDAITAGSLSYDATMVTIFAMAGIPQGEAITGAAIAANMARLVDKKGTPVSFGEVDGIKLSFIEKAHNALVTNQNVDLKGVSGELDFDLTTGEVRTDVVGWGLVPKDGMPDTAVLTPKRLYKLLPAPAETGMWVDLP